MSRPVILICTRCDGGQELFDEVKALRRARGVKELVKVHDVRCLDLCGSPCAVQLEGKKRSTIARILVSAKDDAPALLDAALSFAEGRDLRERDLPGEHAD